MKFGFSFVMFVTCGRATGEDYSVEPADERRPFRALVDVGLQGTTECAFILYLSNSHIFLE